jgi:hypothetical protein
MTEQIATQQLAPDMVVRRALYSHLPAAAFKVHEGVDWVYVGFQWVDFQELCEGIVADLAAAGLGKP